MGGKQLAVHVTKFSENPSEAVEAVETDIPEPQQSEVLVRVTLRPVNPADLLSVRGVYPGFEPAKFPAVPGLEGTGRVERNGPGTTGKFKEGQRVVGMPWGAKDGNGTWAQYVTVPEAALVAVPDELSDETAAQFLVNPFTVYGFFDVLEVPQGEWLLNNAAASVLGRMVIELAKHKGIKTVNLVRSKAAVEELKALGADEVVVTTEEDVVARVKEITGGKGAYSAVESVGGGATVQVVGGTRNNGTVLIYGLLAGPEATFSISDVLFRGVTVKGFWLNVWLGSLGERAGTVVQDAVDLMVKGVLAPLSGKRFPLQEVKAAVEESLKVGRGGKVLLEG